MDVATRKRMTLARYFVPGDLLTLDAGCGNGAFSFHACSIGNRVLGVNNDSGQIRRCEEFRDFLGIQPSRCQFKLHNIYDLTALAQKFDQIICFETLEHLERDQDVIKLFARILNPNGVLHLCTPYLHREPYWGETISAVEDGGHMRLGYTFEVFEQMLSREGFHITVRDRVVGPLGQRVMNLGRWLSDVPLRWLPNSFRQALSGVVVVGLLPLTSIDVLLPRGSHLCIYVQARLD